jgi:hypothetical protein
LTSGIHLQKLVSGQCSHIVALSGGIFQLLDVTSPISRIPHRNRKVGMTFQPVQDHDSGRYYLTISVGRPHRQIRKPVFIGAGFIFKVYFRATEGVEIGKSVGRRWPLEQGGGRGTGG